MARGSHAALGVDFRIRAGRQGGQPDAIYLTGGSWSLRAFQQLLRQRFPGTEIVEGLFGGVASGLAYVGGRR